MLFHTRQHAEPINMQPFFFFATASTVCPAEPWVRQRVRPGRSGESGSACDTQAILTPDLEDQLCHLSALRVSSQRLWLGGPARDPGFPVLALRQGLIQSSFYFSLNKKRTPMEPYTAMSVASDKLDNLRRQ